MTFAGRETSRMSGEPVSLYLFRYGEGATDYCAYTDSERPIAMAPDDTLGTVTFDPLAITRGAIVVSGTLDKASLEVRAARDAEIAEMFVVYPPSQVVTLTIWDGHVGEGEFALAWSGRVINWAFRGDEAVFSAEPASTSLKRVGLYRNYQYQCPLVLYSQGPRKCNANRAAATVVQGVVSVNGSLVGLGAGWAADGLKPRYENGLATWTTPAGRTERRGIVRLQDANTLVLSGPAVDLHPGMAIELTLGCRHDEDDCQNLHNNIHNYGGHPFIPKSNPLGLKNNFN